MPDLINGLGGPAGFGPNVLAVGDDNSSAAIPITAVFPNGLDFYGTVYTTLYINNNGNITFNAPNGTFTPFQITANTNIPIIAPFFADVDTRGGAGTSTGGNATGSNRVYWSLEGNAFTVTWDDVGYFGAHTNKLDAFQVQLINEGNGNFDIEFIYQAINWTTGDASGGSNGLGGTVARAGFSAGDGVHFVELPQSGNQAAMLGLPTSTGNDGTGIYLFHIVGGVVQQSTIYDFVFTYSGGRDYYYGTVADSGSFGYHVGQEITTASGQYQIFNQEGTSSSEASGTVFITYYSHGEPGQASYTPLRDGQGLAAGAGGLGSEADAILGTDGVYHSFSASSQLAITTSGLYGFVFNYADGAAYYFGTVADNGSRGYAAIANSASPYLRVADGYYYVFGEGTTGEASGVVIVNGYREGATATTFTTEHPVNGVSDGSAGLGSESGYFSANRTLFNFTNGQEATDPPPLATTAPGTPLNGPGSSNLLWQDGSGNVAVWQMNGITPGAGVNLGDTGPGWHIVGSGDFYRNGKSDILWQNDSGEAAIWEMNGTTVVGGGNLGNPGPSWRIVGSGDFYGSGQSDILWQNDSGEAAIWKMNGTTVVGGGSLGNPGPNWHIEGTGTFFGNGNSDILWQNDNGETALWEMNGTTVVGGGSLLDPGPSWHIKGTGDFYGDGGSDILWQNNNGEVAIWEMKGMNSVGGGGLGNPGSSWHVIGTGDYGGDGRSDILWQNDNSEAAIWLMNGTTPTFETPVTPNPGLTWHLYAG